MTGNSSNIKQQHEEHIPVLTLTTTLDLIDNVLPMLTSAVCLSYSLRHTCVVLCFQVQVIQFVNVADVHLLFVQLRFVEVLTGAVGRWVMIEDN